MLAVSNRSLVRSLVIGLLPMLGLAACGNETDEATLDGVSSVTGALVSGMTNVTNGQTPNSTFQSETAAVAIGGGEAIAYNTDDSAHGVVSDHYCRNYSEQALTYRVTSTGGWQTFRIPTGAGKSLFYGDPALAARNDPNNFRVYVSSLAVSDAQWNTMPKRADGCISPTTRANAVIDSACVSAVDVPRNGAAASLVWTACMPAAAGDDLDGGNLFLNPSSGLLYAAYWNVARGRIDVYRRGNAFVNVPQPFAGKTIKGHPIFVRNSGAPVLIAPDSAGTFWYSYFDESSSAWTTPVQVATGFKWQDTVQLRNGKTFRQIGYAADWMNGGAFAPYLLFFYQKPRSAAGFTQLQGVTCGTSPSFSCAPNAGLVTPANENALLPAMAVSHSSNRGGPVITPYLSYWTDAGSASGTLALRMALIDVGTLTLVTKATTGTQTPCVVSNYWGDYDQMIVQEEGLATAKLVRPGTDSTGAACNSNGDPQHVSMFSMTP